MRGALAAAALALATLLASCVAEDEPEPTSTPTELPTAAGAPATSTAGAETTGPLSDAEVTALLERAVCWLEDPELAASCLPPDADALEAIAAMGASGDLRFVAPLIDMRWLDLGWGGAVEDALEEITGERFEDPYAWYQYFYRAPVTAGYIEWKAALLALTATTEDGPTFADVLPSLQSTDPTVTPLEAHGVVWTGVQPAAVPPLDAPAVVHRLEERYLDADDVVYGLLIEGEARAYPRRIVAWHGAVNDEVGGTPVLVAACVPCGGAVAYDARVEGSTLRFADAGLAYEGRSLLFDEQTLRLWDAFAGATLTPGHPEEPPAFLEALPLVTTTWGAWSRVHPETGVLTPDTGYERDYEAGAALAADLGSPAPLYPARPPSEAQSALNAKALVAGIEIGGEHRAYPLSSIETRQVVHDRIGSAPVVLLSEGPGLGVRAYAAADTVIDHLEYEADVLIAVDIEGERWFVDERALRSTLDGRERQRLVLRQSYWFAWYGAYPDATLWNGGP